MDKEDRQRARPNAAFGFQAFLHYYLNDRLKILTNAVPKEAKLGRVFPYSIFWLANALPKSELANVRRLALSGVYDCLSVTIADDLLDRQIEADRAILVALAGEYANMRAKLQRELFVPKSRFWDIVSYCRADAAKYNRWNSICTAWSEPLSDKFLRDSSRYVVSVLLPGLAGVAILARSENRIEEISRFLRTFSMAWRIVDDIWDWEEDLHVRNLNNSTILHLIRAKSGADKMSNEIVLAKFLDDNFVREIYQRALELLKRAKKARTN